MSLNTLNGQVQVIGSAKISDSVSLVSQTAGFGTGPLPSKTLNFTYGTGANANAPTQFNVNCWYLASRTVSATTADNLTLYGSLTDAEGNAINFKYIRYICIIISSPDGTKYLNVGPQGVTHAWGGASNMPWPGGAGSTVYDQVWWYWEICHPFAGYTVDHTTPADVLGIDNGSAESVTYGIWIIGEQ